MVGGGTKCHLGTLSFDSLGEMNNYLALGDRHVAVLVHGALALSPESHIEPDFIVIHKVLDDGRFIGEMVDSKSVWKRKGKGKGGGTPHIEKDFRTKVKWVSDKFGLAIRIIASGVVRDLNRKKKGGEKA